MSAHCLSAYVLSAYLPHCRIDFLLQNFQCSCCKCNELKTLLFKVFHDNIYIFGSTRKYSSLSVQLPLGIRFLDFH